MGKVREQLEKESVELVKKRLFTVMKKGAIFTATSQDPSSNKLKQDYVFLQLGSTEEVLMYAIAPDNGAGPQATIDAVDPYQSTKLSCREREQSLTSAEQ